MAETLKVLQLPGTPRSPKTLLHQLLESVDQMEVLLVEVLWKGPPPSLDTFWSDTTNARLVFLERGLNIDITELLKGPQDA